MTDNEKWLRELPSLKERGLKCVFWEHKAENMNRDELLAFIGFLDEQLTYLVSKQSELEGGD